MLPEHQPWNRHAKRYLDLFGNETQYDAWYAAWAAHIPLGGAVLEWGCGPGILAHKVMHARPDLHWLGLDVAPAMVELARQHAPHAQFEVRMTRDPWPQGPFHGLAAGFLLPYLNDEAMQHFIAQTHQHLLPGGMAFISWLDMGLDESRTEFNSYGEAMTVHYRTASCLENHCHAGRLIVTHLPEYRDSDHSKPIHRAAMARRA